VADITAACPLATITGVCGRRDVLVTTPVIPAHHHEEIVLSTSTAARATYQIDPRHTTVEFIVKHLMFSKVRGRFSGVSGTIFVPEGSTVPSEIDVTIDAASVDTRENKRDGHLKSPDFFDVANHPHLTFRSTSVSGSADHLNVTGDLTLHGVTKSVQLDTTYDGAAVDPFGNSRIAFSATATINRKDYGLLLHAPLEAGGVLVGEDIKIELSIQAILQK
jgi:polyisoprenoid-binding protein YceI